MKIKIASLLFACSTLVSNLVADMYVGLDYQYDVNVLKGGIAENPLLSANNAKLKLGYGETGDIKYQARLSYVYFDEAIFDESNQALYELGFDFIKEFRAQENIYPYVKVGFGLGYMPIENVDTSYINSLALNAGFGISFHTVDTLFVVVGFDYLWRQFNDITYTSVETQTLSTHTLGLSTYAGLDYKF